LYLRELIKSFIKEFTVESGRKRVLLVDDNQVNLKMARNTLMNKDGSGYPRGLAGEDIPLQGRIMAVVDVFLEVYPQFKLPARILRPGVKTQRP
jgi:response regulator RpfG family c-di-GMP phosphodiesterase